MSSIYPIYPAALNSSVLPNGGFSFIAAAGPSDWELPFYVEPSHQEMLALGYEYEIPQPDSKDLVGQLSPFYSNSIGIPSLSTDASSTPFHETLATANDVCKPLSSGLNKISQIQSSTWDNSSTCVEFPGSLTPFEEWKTLQTATSADSPLDSLLILEDSPPKAVTSLGKPRRCKVIGDLAAPFRHQKPPKTLDISDESSRIDDNNARSHDLYHRNPQADGLYHCPWEGQDKCKHEANNLKCNYDKFVDAHLKPYHCHASTCEDLRFSSTAILLRHQREAHAMHGNGDKPYLCTYEGCERAIIGNGFPRHWNLRDHMKRVHNDPGPNGKQ